MSKYNWYLGPKTFKSNSGDQLIGQLGFGDEISSGILELKLSSGTTCYLGMASSGSYPSSDRFEGNMDSEYTGIGNCTTEDDNGNEVGEWYCGDHFSDDTAADIWINIPKNNSGSERTINFNYNYNTLFTIIQPVYVNTTKKTYTFNVIYQALFADTDYCLVLVSSTNAYMFSYKTSPQLIDTDNNLINMFMYNKTNTSDSAGIYIEMADSFRDSYNMSYVSGNKTYFNMNNVYYFNYTQANCNVYDTLTKKFTQQKINISDKLALYQVDRTNKTCTQTNLLQFDDPDFVMTLTY